MFNVFYRAHRCLRAGPVPLGPPPQSPCGASLGGLPTQATTASDGPAPLVFASKFMSILMSIFARLGVGLGSILWVLFGLCLALVGPSWSQNVFQLF